MERQIHTIPLQQAIENAHKERASAFASLWRNWFALRSTAFFAAGSQTA